MTATRSTRDDSRPVRAHSSRLIRRAILVSLLLVGCAPVYTKPALNAPLFKRAGDIQLAAHGGLNGVDTQVAIAPTDWLGVIADVSVDADGDNTHTTAEGGIGWYLPFGRNDRGRLDLLVGGGWGKAKGEGTDIVVGTIRASGELALAFFQFDIGFGSKYVDAGFAGRAAYVRFDFDTGGVGVDHIGFFEPGGFVRAGYKFIKFEFQIAAILPVGETAQVDWVPIHMSAGLRFNLGEILFDFYPEDGQRGRNDDEYEYYDE